MPCNKHAAPISLPDGNSKPGISLDHCYECFMVDTRAAMKALVADVKQLKQDTKPVVKTFLHNIFSKDKSNA
jgi:hypothetical protein